ncbi:hypothetical protein [Leptospira sp. 'Mane']
MYEGDAWVSLVAFTMEKVHPDFFFPGANSPVFMKSIFALM